MPPPARRDGRIREQLDQLLEHHGVDHAVAEGLRPRLLRLGRRATAEISDSSRSSSRRLEVGQRRAVDQLAKSTVRLPLATSVISGREISASPPCVRFWMRARWWRPSSSISA
jgi:hypothetical protein